MADWFYASDGNRAGPYSTEEMRQFAASGRFDAATLVWNAAYGEQWRPVGESEFRPAGPPPVSHPRVPVPPAVRAGPNRAAWYAFGGCLLVLVLLLVALPLLRNATAPATIVAADTTPPAPVPPAAGPSATPPVQDVESTLPKCASAAGAADVLRIANTLDNFTTASLTAVSLDDRRQVSSAADKRACHGTLLVSDQSRYPIDYSFEPQPNGGPPLIRLLVHMLMTCQSKQASLEVIHLANTLAKFKTYAVVGVSLGDQAQVDASDARRSCTGTLLASDGSTHRTAYYFELQGGQVYSHINVE